MSNITKTLDDEIIRKVRRIAKREEQRVEEIIAELEILMNAQENRVELHDR